MAIFSVSAISWAVSPMLCEQSPNLDDSYLRASESFLCALHSPCTTHVLSSQFAFNCLCSFAVHSFSLALVGLAWGACWAAAVYFCCSSTYPRCTDLRSFLIFTPVSLLLSDLMLHLNWKMQCRYRLIRPSRTTCEERKNLFTMSAFLFLSSIPTSSPEDAPARRKANILFEYGLMNEWLLDLYEGVFSRLH